MGTGHQRKTGSLRYLTTKLALAAGITRPYLSDIETGKAHPSEALQEAITEALERFNPDAPLEMLFDYVRIRFPTYGCEAYRGRRTAAKAALLYP